MADVIPENTIPNGIEIVEYPSKTYKIDDTTNQSFGYIDYLQACIQTLDAIVNTQRYAYPIFSSNYGVDFSKLIGQEDDFIISEVITQLKDSLINDSRFLDVTLDSFSRGEDSLKIILNITTKYGNFIKDINIEE